MARQQEEWLVVDGYNVIGNGPQSHWTASHLEEERLKLVRDLSEYQAITGRKVYLVFDAYQTKLPQLKQVQEKIIIYYTGRDETADGFIEQFVKKNKNPHRRIYVATSDYLEQRMVFGQGAYRISSRELIEEVRTAKIKLSEKLRKGGEEIQKSSLGERISADIKQQLEKFRRKK